MARNDRNPHPIARSCRRLKLTYQQLADRAGLNLGYLRQIASGIRKPSFDVADKAAGGLTSSDSARERLTVRIMRFPYRSAS